MVPFSRILPYTVYLGKKIPYWTCIPSFCLTGLEEKANEIAICSRCEIENI